VTNNPWRRRAAAAAAIAALFVCAPAALAADVNTGWGSWWLPPNRSTHGGQIDTLFNVIFWITTVTFVAVELLLVVFLIKYRHNPNRKKGIFTHGNTRLEMAWTLAPALILALLALFSKKVWDNYRYSPAMDDASRAKVLVIGERFKWNVIYPGPDGKIGRYLIYPQPYDAKWPDGSNFKNVPGPAYLHYNDAIAAIKEYNLAPREHTYGKDMEDPDGKDDDWLQAQARDLTIPVNRPIEVQLGSKDVLHDFFLPNYRVKLDAVPGMRGHIFFTATMTSKELEQKTVKNYKLNELTAALKAPGGKDLVVRINETSPGTDQNKMKDSNGWKYFNPADKKKATIIRDGKGIPDDQIDTVVKKLQDAGLTEVTMFAPGYWELVCEELCGEGHGTMKGRVFVVTQEEFDNLHLDKPSTAPPPSVAMGVTK